MHVFDHFKLRFLGSKSEILSLEIVVLDSCLFSSCFFKMGKLNVNMLRYLTKDEFRILVAVEMGMKNHELVPKSLVVSIAQVRSGVAKLLRDLCKNRQVK